MPVYCQQFVLAAARSWTQPRSTVYRGRAESLWNVAMHHRQKNRSPLPRSGPLLIP